MHSTMMPPTEWDRELIADLAAERTGLGKSEVVGVRGLAAAHETRLLGDIAQVIPVAIAPRRGNREDTLVNASAVIIFSPGSLRLLLRRLLGGRGTLSHGNVVYAGRREARHFLLERVLEDFGIARNELVGIVISTHLLPPVMIDSTEVLKWLTHMLCWTWAIYFSAAASSENDQGSMNLASNTASVPSTIPSRVAAIQGMAECLTRRCTSRTCRPVLRSYQERLNSSVALPSCTMRLPDRSSGSASPRFSRQSRTKAASSLPMMIRASEPPTKKRRRGPATFGNRTSLSDMSILHIHDRRY